MIGSFRAAISRNSTKRGRQPTSHCVLVAPAKPSRLDLLHPRSTTGTPSAAKTRRCRTSHVLGLRGAQTRGRYDDARLHREIQRTTDFHSSDSREFSRHRREDVAISRLVVLAE